eukprot:4804338-Amphidinium_carterae.1
MEPRRLMGQFTKVGMKRLQGSSNPTVLLLSQPLPSSFIFRFPFYTASHGEVWPLICSLSQLQRCLCSYCKDHSVLPRVCGRRRSRRYRRVVGVMVNLQLRNGEALHKRSGRQDEELVVVPSAMTSTCHRTAMNNAHARRESNSHTHCMLSSFQ